VELGIGAGWMEREHTAYSYDFPEPGPRVSMFEEALQVIDSLMTKERTNFDGTYYQFVDAPFEPKPLQKPRIPIIVGGSGPRMMRIAARYADNWNTRGTPEAVAPTIERFHAACAAVGRDPNTIRCSVFPWVHAFESEEQFADIVKAYMALGFSDIAFPMPPEEFRPMMERCARDVLPELRRLS
jgi:alkanesulfonate monooxygenase SsuD/methylene tetrahydromethanopterin reductase-like flavin-dependent oxidoreductase (luciferase family)